MFSSFTTYHKYLVLVIYLTLYAFLHWQNKQNKRKSQYKRNVEGLPKKRLLSVPTSKYIITMI